MKFTAILALAATAAATTDATTDATTCGLSWTGTCPTDAKISREQHVLADGKALDATKCCEYNCKTSFVGTCTGDKVPLDKGFTIDEDGKIDVQEDGKIMYKMALADYWKWNGVEKDPHLGCCQTTCKSAGLTCTAKDDKEMVLKDSGKEVCGGADPCTQKKFDDECCDEKTCAQDKCEANGNNWDDDCAKYAGCAAECNLSKESTKDELDKCAACAIVKKEWCGGCLQCLHDIHLKLDWKLKVEKDNTLFSGATNTKLSSSFLTAAIASVTVAVTALAL